tara:strand:+ start:8914 stop:10101 length:1188 start_codon:yes stop_codon:yes gene_type:complete
MPNKILNIIANIATTADWKPKLTRSEAVVVDPMPGFDAMFTFRIEPKGAKLKNVIQKMASESPKYKKIFGNLPTSRSMLLKILTNRLGGDSAEMANAKAAAIKAFYRAQQPLLDVIKEKLMKAYPGKDFIFNPIEFKYSGAGDTVWEGYMHTIAKASPTPPPELAKDLSIVTPDPKRPVQTQSDVEEEMVKVDKHILARSEIDSIINELVQKLGLNPSTDLVVVDNSAKALSEYEDMRIGSVLKEVPTVEVSDSYNSRVPKKEITYNKKAEPTPGFDMPNVVAYIQTTKGRKVTSRDEWMKLMQGRQPTGVPNPISPAHSRKSKKLSRYGAPIAKEIRKKQEATRTYDEIAVYADINHATNRFTGKARKWGGEVRYTFFIIIPKEVYVPKSKLRK